MQIITKGNANYDIGDMPNRKIIAWGYAKSSEGSQAYADVEG